MRRNFDDEDDDDDEIENEDLINIIEDGEGEESLSDLLSEMSEEDMAELVFDSYEQIYDGLDVIAEVMEFLYKKSNETEENLNSEVLLLKEKNKGYEAEIRRLYLEIAKLSSDEGKSNIGDNKNEF